MNPFTLDELCERVSALFGLDERDALALGFPAVIADVEVELICPGWEAGRVTAVLELGTLAEGRREACFMKALQLQGQLQLAMWAHFVIDPVNDRLMWCVNVPLHADADPQSVADLIRCLVEQVHAWRTGAFDGLLSAEQSSEAAGS